MNYNLVEIKSVTENKETFQARIKPFFSPSDQLDIKLAYTLAKFGHRAQLRKELVDGKPVRYFEHVRRVAIVLMDEMKIMDRDMIIAALLHDSLEDTEDLTAELLEHSFGIQVATMVTLLSKIPKEGYHERLKNCHNWKTLAIKMCDRTDNFRSLFVPGVSLEFQKKQIQETKQHYIPLFDQLLQLCPSVHSANIFLIRDELKDLIVEYSTTIKLREGQTA
jgi:GTP diphosphokinase / guanosine-3',5'-bis(diphosphate) 3'-diphosphatase